MRDVLADLSVRTGCRTGAGRTKIRRWIHVNRESGCPADNLWHTLTSALVHFSLFASMAAFIIAAYSAPRRWPLVGRWARWLMPVSMAAAISSVGPYVGWPGGHGIAQRIHLVTVALWFFLLAAELRCRRTDGEGTA
ncbi:hypothetical protein [Streptomyces silvisoli]|uniref:DUF998 domain-containing protein n=1 Tax=Streptomyces silvisoli TaxID=3034235 RepID=A0ABT5ZVQ5_9ACTN|nr:hypothetical protein [Streptomyces silvisoli]MDF3293908.1 hypothetical protein [Streptomyces silvisoli]